MFGTIEAGAPEALGADISSTTMAKPSPDAKRPPRSAHQRVDARRPSPQQRAPAVPIEQLLEALPDAVVLVDAGGQIVYANGLLFTDAPGGPGIAIDPSGQGDVTKTHEKWKIEKTVFIKSPKSVRYGDVVRVIDAAKEAGASPIGLQIDDLQD